MAERSLFAIPDLPVTAGRGRVLTCTECRAVVEVFELPRQHLEPSSFTCVSCLLDPEPQPEAAA